MTGLSTALRLDLWNIEIVLELGLEQEGERKGSVALPRWLLRTDCSALSGLMQGRAGVWLTGAHPLLREDTGSNGSGLSFGSFSPSFGGQGSAFLDSEGVSILEKDSPSDWLRDVASSRGLSFPHSFPTSSLSSVSFLTWVYRARFVGTGPSGMTFHLGAMGLSLLARLGLICSI